MANSEAVENVVEEEVAVEETAQQETPVESISLQDLQVLSNIVDLATQRGAFRGNELTQVGAVFDKLSTFLQQVAAAQSANNEESDGVEGTEEA
jgi:hypothetical protein